MRTPRVVAGSVVAATLLASLFVACGNEPAPSLPAQPTEKPAETPPPAEEAKPDPTASAKASATPEAPKKDASSGRPAVLKRDSDEITDTFGSSPASKLELGDKEIATLRLPEGGLRTGTLITFRLAKGGKSTGGQLGRIYEIKALIPPSTTPEQMESQGPPFVLELPAGHKKDANLAIGVENDKGKIKWTVVASKRIDDARNVAVFELSTLPSGYLHVTTKAAGAEK